MALLSLGLFFSVVSFQQFNPSPLLITMTLLVRPCTPPLAPLDLPIRMYYLSPLGDNTKDSMYFDPTSPFVISLLSRTQKPSLAPRPFEG